MRRRFHTAICMGCLLWSTFGSGIAGQGHQEAVQVSGTVRYNGQPLASREVIFQPVELPSRVTRTDATGSYAVTLQGPGEYFVVLEAVPFDRRPVTVKAGANALDIDFAGGQITVEVEGLSSDVMVELHSGPSFAARRIRPREQHSWEGLKFGEYVVSATGYRVHAVRVDLSESNATELVRLRLGGHSSELHLVDDGGRPVPGVSFPNLNQQPVELSPGRFQLDAVAPKTSLRIRPPNGFAPTCRIVRVDESSDVVIGKSQPGSIVFEGIQPIQLGRGSGQIQGVQGSECAVPLTDFGIIRTVAIEGGFRVELENLPRVSEPLVITIPGAWTKFTIGPDGTAHARFHRP